MLLTISGSSFRHCDGVTRRDFLTAGTLGFAGLTLADLLRVEAAAGIRSSHKAIINVHLDGGPPQMDTIDLKPHAPVEIRGEFQPIATRIPGVHVCELLPKLAGIADRFVFIRTLVGSTGQHNAFQCQSGFDEQDLKPIGGRPALGSVLDKLRGSTNDTAPSFVDLMQGRPLVRNSARPGFLGPAYGPFRPNMAKWFSRPLEEGMKKELARLGNHHATSLTLNAELDARRLDDRLRLLGGLDTLRREIDGSGMMGAIDRFNEQAISILTSGQFADALDLGKEDPRVLERYTPRPDAGERFYTAEDHLSARKFLLARRLVEAGVRCVSVSISDFDTHRDNFPRMRQLLPIVDHGLHTLVTDLEERGRLDDVLIVVWGEFGRTPRINPSGGRDHWPKVSPALLAGGGLRTGQVIGETDRTASLAVSRPIHFQDIFATLYHKLGIDLRATTLTDTHGRPHYLVPEGQVLREVL